MLYMLEPEVAGEFGEETSYQNFVNVRLKGERPIVDKLNYHFTGWLGDELLEATPCFIITKELATTIEKSSLTGYRFEEVIVSLSDDFIEMYPNKKLPTFKRLVPIGSVFIENEHFKEWSGADICISQKSYLVFTEKALTIFKNHRIYNCEITELYE